MKRREWAVQLASDIFTINLAWSLYYLFRVKTGWLTYGIEPDYMLPMLAICVFWLLLFFLFGLYRSWYTKSRFDELLRKLRATREWDFVAREVELRLERVA